MKSPQLMPCLTVKEWSLPEIRKKTRMPAFHSFIYSTLYKSSSQSNWARKRNKRHPNWEGRSKPIRNHKWYTHTENPKYTHTHTQLNKELQQSCRAQGQYTKFSLLLYIQFFYFPYFKKFVIGRQFIYNIVLVSAMHQHESATGIHMFPPSVLPFHLPPHPTPIPLGCHRVPDLSSLHHTANFH